EEVTEAVVVVREDQAGDKRLVGYVAAKAGEFGGASELRRRLQAKLPEDMVPGLLVVLAEMPLAPNGKIDRAALPAVDLDRNLHYEPPQTPVQDVVASILAEVLGVERVGIDDDFFELGGHSLLATKAMTRVREAFQVEVPLRVLFEAPRARKLA